MYSFLKHQVQRSVKKWQASQVLTDVTKRLSFRVRFYFDKQVWEVRNKRTFLACLDPLGRLVRQKRRSFRRGISKIGQDVIYSHHLSFDQRADRGQAILLNNPSFRL